MSNARSFSATTTDANPKAALDTTDSPHKYRNLRVWNSNASNDGWVSFDFDTAGARIWRYIEQGEPRLFADAQITLPIQVKRAGAVNVTFYGDLW